MGQHDRPGQAFDTDAVFRDLLAMCLADAKAPRDLRPSTPRRAGLTACRSRLSRSPTWCALQKKLVNHLGIERLLAVAGGSMGGMQVLEWAVEYPGRCLLHPDCHDIAAQRAADRLQRSRPSGDHGRSRLVRRQTTTIEAAGPRTVGRAHGRTYHVYERRFDA